jgi:hypothetical protein
VLISWNESHCTLTPTGVDCGYMLSCMANGVLSATRFAYLVSYPRGELVKMSTQLRVGLYGLGFIDWPVREQTPGARPSGSLPGA